MKEFNFLDANEAKQLTEKPATFWGVYHIMEQIQYAARLGQYHIDIYAAPRVDVSDKEIDRETEIKTMLENLGYKVTLNVLEPDDKIDSRGIKMHVLWEDIEIE